ncbi:MAG TPA: nitronate monooxygenase family protein [Hyphomonadaceae bacterium]|jgi:nitronate monooxygenase|nr:nitronate monooxygenase family protein [Hyphomonadaceae bacterium]
MAIPASLANMLSIPVIGSPLFIISNPDLVLAQCKAGIIGSFPSLNARPIEQLDEWLSRINEELSAARRANPAARIAPYAVNLIVHKSNQRIEEDLAMCVKHKVPMVITSLGARPEVNEAIHSYGGIVMHDIINIVFAHKALEKGADGLIAVSAGAGGHAGVLSPFALIQEIREFFKGPLALSGAIATGSAVLAAQAMGADFAYIGSAFIPTHEARAPDRYKNMIVESAAKDIVYSSLFTGVHGNYLSPSVAAAGMDPNNLPDGDKAQMSFKAGEGSKAKAWKDVWGSGQGIGAVQARMGAGEYIAQLKREYEEARTSLAKDAAAFV